MTSLSKDYRGLQLCDPCFNNQHFHRERDVEGKSTGNYIVDCLEGGCECPCRQLLQEQRKRVRKAKPDYTNQISLIDSPLSGQENTNEHRDEN